MPSSPRSTASGATIWPTAATRSPSRMALRSGGGRCHWSARRCPAALPAPRRKLVVLVHGLCMSDLQWSRRGHDHGAGAGARPRLHAGLPALQQRPPRLAERPRLRRAAGASWSRWPVPVEELVIVGHSMGGLVARSACHHAADAGPALAASLRTLVFLGTPHHGAPLERGGRCDRHAAGLSPYVAPLRAAGQGAQRRHHRPALRQPAGRRLAGPRPPRAAPRRPPADAAARRRGRLPAWPPPPPSKPAACARHALIGDGLVPLASALGEHRDPRSVAAGASQPPPRGRRLRPPRPAVPRRGAAAAAGMARPRRALKRPMSPAERA